MSLESWDRELDGLERDVKRLGVAVCIFAGVVLGKVIWLVFF